MAGILILIIIGLSNYIHQNAHAETNKPIADSVITGYLNAEYKELYVGRQGNSKYNFDINLSIEKKGTTYLWYVVKDKGNPNSVKINNKTGEVTAKEVGTAYIRCQVTYPDGTVLRPEAKVVVWNNITEVKICNIPSNQALIAGKAYNCLKIRLLFWNNNL